MVYIHWLKTQPWSRTKDVYTMRLGKRATATCISPQLSVTEQVEIDAWFHSKGISSENWSFKPYRKVYSSEFGMVYCAGIDFNITLNAYTCLMKINE
jgi:hypothetical protein